MGSSIKLFRLKDKIFSLKLVIDEYDYHAIAMGSNGLDGLRTEIRARIAHQLAEKIIKLIEIESIKRPEGGTEFRVEGAIFSRDEYMEIQNIINIINKEEQTWREV